jgi:hypothetical protein
MHTPTSVKEACAFTFFSARKTHEPLTADEQRSLWGAAPFGRLRVRWSERGVQVVHRTISRDWNHQTVPWSEVAAALNEGRQVRYCR